MMEPYFVELPKSWGRIAKSVPKDVAKEWGAIDLNGWFPPMAMCDACELQGVRKSRMLMADCSELDVCDDFLSCCAGAVFVSDPLAWMAGMIMVLSHHPGKECDLWVYDDVFLPVNATFHSEGSNWWIDARAIRLERSAFVEVRLGGRISCCSKLVEDWLPLLVRIVVPNRLEKKSNGGP